MRQGEYSLPRLMPHKGRFCYRGAQNFGEAERFSKPTMRWGRCQPLLIVLANTLVRFTPGNRLQHCLIVRFAGGPGAGAADGIRFRDNRESCEQLQEIR